MNKFLTGTIAAIAVAVAVPALAADMAPRYSKAPPPAPIMVYNWTGCYIGGNVGGGWARTSQTQIAKVERSAIIRTTTSAAARNGTWIGGGQIGCDTSSPATGVGAGHGDAGNLRSSHVVPTVPGFPVGAFISDNTVNYTGSATGRIGELFAPQVLAYVEGGAAWANQDHNFIGTIPATCLSESANSVDRFGWTVGGGLEWMFAHGWSVFGEYNYMDFGRKDVGFIAGPATVGAPDIVSTRLTIQQALVGVNYKFNWGGPVVAKY